MTIPAGYESTFETTVSPDALASANGSGNARSVAAERPDLGLDDVGNASRYAEQHGGDVRYVPAFGRWLVWDGARLADDDQLEHLRRAKATVRGLADEAAAEPDEQRRKDLLGHARRSASEPRLRAMLTLAAADPRIVVRPAELDADPYALNTPSGVVDLRNAKVRAHRRGEPVTLVAGAAYDPDAAAPLWEAHLRRCLVSPELVGFLQRLAGLSAIGLVLEHVLAILHGSGANGKTVTVGALAGALGDYAHESTVDLILQTGRSPGQATPEVADLRGRRLVTVEETREDGRLASERVKWITGGGALRARHLHANPFSFEPSHTLWVATNHRPRVGDDSHAIWRRIVLLPFAVTISEQEQDRELPAKLAAERPGILRWIVEGAAAYLREGLSPPAPVRAAIASYREDEDAFGLFLAERTAAEPDASAGASELGRAHTAWAEASGAPALSANALAEKLAARGYERKRVRTGTRYLGLRLHHEGTLDA